MSKNHTGQARKRGLGYRGARTHFDIAVAMITIIPFLCLFTLSTPAARELLSTWEHSLIVGVGVVLFPAVGYSILARYPAAILKLKHHLNDIVRGEIPEQIDLIADEADVAAVELAVNIVLDRLRERVEKVSAENDHLQDELLQSRKLEAVGSLAYGVAHEIATPLQILRSNFQFVSQVAVTLAQTGDPELVPELKLSAMQTESAVEDVSSTLSALRDFAPHSRKPRSRAATDLNETIRRTVSLSRNEWKYIADVDLDLDDSLPSIVCAAGEIKQVLVNLTMNATQAIRTQQEERGIKDKGTIRFTTHSVAGGACIEVSDSGCGISAETVPRIFDPFFSTDGDGLHYGRGLSLAYATIVHDHAGKISCQSTQGEGTTIRFTLPHKKRETSHEHRAHNTQTACAVC